MTGTLHTDRHTFMIIFRLFLLRIRNVSNNICKRKSKHILCSIFLSFQNRYVYETICNNTVEPNRSHMTTWRMHIACWIPKATNTHSQYVILRQVGGQSKTLLVSYIKDVYSKIRNKTTRFGLIWPSSGFSFP